MDFNGYESARKSLSQFSGTEIGHIGKDAAFASFKCVISPEVEEGQETRFITIRLPERPDEGLIFGPEAILNALSIAGIMEIDGESIRNNMSPVLDVLAINGNEITFEDMNFPLHGNTVKI